MRTQLETINGVVSNGEFSVFPIRTGPANTKTSAANKAPILNEIAEAKACPMWKAVAMSINRQMPLESTFETDLGQVAKQTPQTIAPARDTHTTNRDASKGLVVQGAALSVGQTSTCEFGSMVSS